MNIIGIDPSLNGTGIFIYNTENLWIKYEYFRITHDDNYEQNFYENYYGLKFKNKTQFKKHKKLNKSKKYDEDYRINRIVRIYSTISDLIVDYDIKYAVIEKQFASEQIEIQTISFLPFYLKNIPVYHYMPSQWFKLLYGSGRMDKDKLIKSVQEKVGDGVENMYELNKNGKLKQDDILNACGILFAHLNKIKSQK